MKTPLLITILFAFSSTIAHADTTYTVRAGDTLLSIADRTLGDVQNKKDPRRYEVARKIKAKNPQLKDPNSLTPGETITIPDANSSDKSARPAKPAPAPVAKAPVIPPPAPLPEPEHAAPTEVATSEPAIPIIKQEQATAPAPAPAKAEQAAPAEAHASGGHHEENFDYIAVQPRYQFTHIKVKDLATDEEYKTDSKTSAGIDLQYAKAFGERTRLLVQFGYTSTQYKQFDSATRTLEHLNETQMSYGLGVANELTSTLHLDAMAKMADRTFLIPVDAATYEAHKMMLPGAELALGWDFVSTNSYVVGGSLIGEYIGGATKDGIKYKSAVDPLAMLYFTSKRGSDKMNYRVSALYDKRDQNTDVTEQVEDTWVAGLTLYFPL